MASCQETRPLLDNTTPGYVPEPVEYPPALDKDASDKKLTELRKLLEPEPIPAAPLDNRTVTKETQKLQPKRQAAQAVEKLQVRIPRAPAIDGLEAQRKVAERMAATSDLLDICGRRRINLDHVRTVESLLKKHPEIADCVDPHGDSALNLAVKSVSREDSHLWGQICGMLLFNTADPFRVGTDRRMPMDHLFGSASDWKMLEEVVKHSKVQLPWNQYFEIATELPSTQSFRDTLRLMSECDLKPAVLFTYLFRIPWKPRSPLWTSLDSLIEIIQAGVNLETDFPHNLNETVAADRSNTSRKKKIAFLQSRGFKIRETNENGYSRAVTQKKTARVSRALNRLRSTRSEGRWNLQIKAPNNALTPAYGD